MAEKVIYLDLCWLKVNRKKILAKNYQLIFLDVNKDDESSIMDISDFRENFWREIYLKKWLNILFLRKYNRKLYWRSAKTLSKVKDSLRNVSRIGRKYFYYKKRKWFYLWYENPKEIAIEYWKEITKKKFITVKRQKKIFSIYFDRILAKIKIKQKKVGLKRFYQDLSITQDLSYLLSLLERYIEKT